MSHSFRHAVETRDLEAMRDALHPQVRFCSPVVFKPYRLETLSGVLDDVLAPKREGPA